MDPFDVQPQRQPLRVSGPVQQPRISQAPAPQYQPISYQPVQTPALSMAAPPAYQPLSVQRIGTDVNPFIEQDDINYTIADGSQVNPLTGEAYKPGQVVFEGPDWLVNSEIFKKTIQPRLERPVQYDGEGKPVHDVLTDEFKQYLDTVREAYMAIDQYRETSPGATEQDAMTYLQNIAASEASDKDENTQIVYGLNPDGSYQFASVKEVVDNIKSMSDAQKGAMYRNYRDILDSDEATPTQRAITESVLQFALNKNLLSGSGGTQARVGLTAATAQSDSGAVGWLSDRYSSFFGTLGEGARTGEFDWTTNAQRAREALDNDPLAQLPNVQNARAVGSLFGVGSSLVADVVASNVIGAGMIGGLNRIRQTGQTLSGAGRTVKSLDAVADSLVKLANSGSAGRIAARTISTVPEEAVFGGLQAAANAGEYDTVREFAIGIGANAALLGGARLSGRAISAIDPDASVKFARVNDDISRAIVKGWDGFTDLPGLKGALNKIMPATVDSQRTAVRTARKLAAETAPRGEFRNYLKAFYNDIADYRDRGGTVYRNLMDSEAVKPFSDRVNDFEIRLAAQGDEVAQQAKNYAWASLQKQYHDAGRVKYPESYVKQLDEAIEAGAGRQEFEDYRQALVDLQARVVDYFSSQGILDADVIRTMRESDAFKNNYIHMARIVDPEWQPTFSKKFKDRAAVRRIKGGMQELVDPQQAVLEHAKALSETLAQNKVTNLFVQANEAGLVAGRFAQTPETVREFKKLDATLRAEAQAVIEIMDETGFRLAQDATSLVDDAEDIYGKSYDRISALMDDSLDEILDAIQGEKRFQPAIKQVVSELPENVVNPERTAALEIFGAYKDDLMKGFQRQFDKTRLDREASDYLERILGSKLDEQTQLARAEAQGVEVPTSGESLTTDVPLGERRKELKSLRAQLEPIDDKVTVPYYRNGARGYFEVDDPVLREYFTSTRRNPVDDGLIARLFTNSSRIFRAATTGLNPVFAFMVNPTRDVYQAGITTGFDAMRPVNLTREIMTSSNIPRETAESFARQIENSLSRSLQTTTSRLDAPLATQSRAAYRSQQASGAKEHIIALKDNFKADRSALKKIEDLTMGAPEQYVRKQAAATAYNKAKAIGASDEVALSNAIFAGKNATTDFNIVGQKTQSILRTIPYMSAAINGQASFLRMWQMDPVGMTARLAAGAVTPTVFMAAHNMRDDETSAAYFDIPEWERRANFIVMLPGNEVLKIPLPQEVAGVLNPIVERMEAAHGLDRDLADTIFRTILAQSPVDLTGFAETDFQGNRDFWGGVTQAAASATPQLIQAPLEVAAGRDFFTGRPLAPTDAELVARGDAEYGSITNSQRTFAGRNSRVLGFIADKIGIPQGNLQNVVSNYGGGVGQFILNGLDRMAGAPEEERGGRSVLENAAQRYFGKSYSQATQDFYQGINNLEADKKILQAQLRELNLRANYEPENQDAIIQQRQAAIDSYGSKVSEFVQDYGNFYNQTGGLKASQLNAVMRLLNLYEDTGAFEPGTANAAAGTEAFFAGQEEARARALQLGLPDTTARDQFGQLRARDDGELYTDFGDVSMAGRVLTDVQYGAPRQMLYEFEQIFKGDKDANIPSMRDIQKAYRDMMDPLYTRAQGQKGKARQATYDEITALQHEYLGQLGKRLEPILNKYGTSSLANNRQVLEEVAKYVMVPGDFTPFAPGKSKQPYMTRDAAAFIADYFGVGNLNASNIPTDESVIAGIRQATQELDAGRTSSALFRLNNLQNNINEGINYADHDNMAEIRRLIELANGKR